MKPEKMIQHLSERGELAMKVHGILHGPHDTCRIDYMQEAALFESYADLAELKRDGDPNVTNTAYLMLHGVINWLARTGAVTETQFNQLYNLLWDVRDGKQ